MIQDATIKPVSPSIPRDGSGAAPSQVSQVAAVRTHVWANLENFTGPATGFKAVYLKLFADGIFLEMDNARYRLPFDNNLETEFDGLKKLEPVFENGYPFLTCTMVGRDVKKTNNAKSDRTLRFLAGQKSIFYQLHDKTANTRS